MESAMARSPSPAAIRTLSLALYGRVPTEAEIPELRDALLAVYGVDDYDAAARVAVRECAAQLAKDCPAPSSCTCNHRLRKGRQPPYVERDPECAIHGDAVVGKVRVEHL